MRAHQIRRSRNGAQLELLRKLVLLLRRLRALLVPAVIIALAMEARLSAVRATLRVATPPLAHRRQTADSQHQRTPEASQSQRQGSGQSQVT